MSTLLQIIAKFFVESVRLFNSFLVSLYGLITGRRQIQASRPADDQQHDDPHVHFTKSVAEKPSAVPPKKKLERRPTSGKGLLSTPLEELLDDSDSDDGELSIHSLASSSSFQVAPVKTDTKAQDKKGVNWEKTAPGGTDKKASDDSEDKGTASGAAQKPKKRVSILNDDTLPPTVQKKLGNFIKNLPKVTPNEFDKTFEEIVVEFPRFKKIKSKQVYEIIERDLDAYKSLPTEAAAEKLMEALCSCPKKH